MPPRAATAPAPAVRNGGFEQVGAARDFARRAADGWMISGDAVAIGAIARKAWPQFAMAGEQCLFVGVDHVGGRSTSGSAWQDLGTSVKGMYYTVSARVLKADDFPLGYRIALADPLGGAELAGITEKGHSPQRVGETITVRFAYQETQARALRLVIRTNGAAAPGGALRAGIDDVAVEVSADKPPDGTQVLTPPPPPKPPTPTGPTVEIDNSLVKVRLSPTSDGVRQEYFAARDGQWVLVAEALKPPTPPSGAPRACGEPLYDSGIDKLHRLIVTEILTSVGPPRRDQGAWQVTLRGAAEAGTVTQTVTLRPGERFAHIEVSAELTARPPRLEYLLLPLAAKLEGPVDFSHVPAYKHGGDYLAADRDWAAPAAIVQKGPLLAAIVPDVDVVNEAVVYARGARPNSSPHGFLVRVDPDKVSMPTAMDLNLQSPLAAGALLACGLIDIINEPHVYWRHDNTPGAMVRQLSANRVRFAMDLFVQADATPYRGYQQVSRHLWERFGSRYFRRPRPQAMPFEEYARVCYPAYAAYQGYEVAGGGVKNRDVPGRGDLNSWQQWEQGGKPVGGWRLTAPQWYHLVYNTAWWNNVCDATGMYFWGKRLPDDTLIDKARRAINLTVSAPQKEGLFGSLYDLNSRRWLGSLWHPPLTGYDPNRADCYWNWTAGAYQTASASVTAGYLLEYRRSCEDDPGILPFVRRYGDFLAARVQANGCVPAWFDAELRPLPSLSWNADGGAHVWVLAELYRATKDAKYLDAARKIARTMVEQVLPGQRWSDFEAFYSCAVKPETFRDPFTGQPARSTLSMIWAVQGFTALYEATRASQRSSAAATQSSTGERAWLDAAEAVADYAGFFQAVWAPNFVITAYPFGGFSSQTGDGEWLDQRSHRLAGPMIRLGLLLGRGDLLERGVALARASLTLVNHPSHLRNGIYEHPNFPVGLGPENIDHEGLPQMPMGSGPSWSSVGGLAAAGDALRLLGGLWADPARGLAVGVDGVLVKSCRLDGRRIDLELVNPLSRLSVPYDKPYTVRLRLAGLADGRYELRVNPLGAKPVEATAEQLRDYPLRIGN